MDEEDSGKMTDEEQEAKETKVAGWKGMLVVV